MRKEGMGCRWVYAARIKHKMVKLLYTTMQHEWQQRCCVAYLVISASLMAGAAKSTQQAGQKHIIHSRKCGLANGKKERDAWERKGMDESGCVRHAASIAVSLSVSFSLCHACCSVLVFLLSLLEHSASDYNTQLTQLTGAWFAL